MKIQKVKTLVIGSFFVLLSSHGEASVNSCVKLLENSFSTEVSFQSPTSDQSPTDFQKILSDLKKLPREASSGTVMNFLTLKLRGLTEKVNQSIQEAQFQVEELQPTDGRSSATAFLQSRMSQNSKDLLDLDRELAGQDLSSLKKSNIEKLKSLQATYKVIVDLQKDFDHEVSLLVQAKEQVGLAKVELQKAISTLDQLLEHILDESRTPEFSSHLRNTLLEHILTQTNSLNTQNLLVTSLDSALISVTLTQSQVRKSLMEFTTFPLISKFLKELTERDQKTAIQESELGNPQRLLAVGEKVTSVFGPAEIEANEGNRYTIRYWTTWGPKRRTVQREWVGNSQPAAEWKGVRVGDRIFIDDESITYYSREYGSLAASGQYRGTGKIIGITNEGLFLVKVYRLFVDTIQLPLAIGTGGSIFTYGLLSKHRFRVIKKARR